MTLHEPLDVDLNGLWQCHDYECPWGVRQTEVVSISHRDERIVAIKVTGDDCVPAGFESFSGRLPTGRRLGAITWALGWPWAPASNTERGFLRVIDADAFAAGYSATGELRFCRLTDGPAVDERMD